MGGIADRHVHPTIAKDSRLCSETFLIFPCKQFGVVFDKAVAVMLQGIGRIKIDEIRSPCAMRNLGEVADNEFGFIQGLRNFSYPCKGRFRVIQFVAVRNVVGPCKILAVDAVEW